MRIRRLPEEEPRPIGRPVGFVESNETRAKKRAAMLAKRGERQPVPTWHESFVPWGNRLHFLSPERAHLETGGIRILPARKREPRGEEE